MSKGVSQIATMALYVGISVTAISGSLTVGLPAIENMQSAASIRQAQNFMNRLDSNVQQVVSEGEGSTRTMDVNFDRGKLYFDNDTSSLIYELRTDADVISPQSSRRTGNIILSSNADVEVYPAEVNSSGVFEVSEEEANCWMMDNDRVQACINKVGGPDDYQPINTSELLKHYKLVDGAQKELEGNLTVELNEIESTSYGEGYTEPRNTGDFIGTGQVKATVASDYGFTYDVIFRLPTGADFLKIDVQNFR